MSKKLSVQDLIGDITMKKLQNKYVDLGELVRNDRIEDEAIIELIEYFPWGDHDFCEYEIKIPLIKIIDALEKLDKRVYWHSLSLNTDIGKLPPNFIEKHAKDLSLDCIIGRHNYLIEDGYLDILLKNGVSWEEICFYQKLPITFIEEHKLKVDWINIAIHQILPMSFIEQYIEYLDWDLISRYQELSEQFMSKYKDKINWDLISRYQELSRELIVKHRNKINFREFCYHNFKSSKDVKNEFMDYKFLPNECMTYRLSLLSYSDYRRKI